MSLLSSSLYFFPLTYYVHFQCTICPLCVSDTHTAALTFSLPFRLLLWHFEEQLYFHSDFSGVCRIFVPLWGILSNAVFKGFFHCCWNGSPAHIRWLYIYFSPTILQVPYTCKRVHILDRNGYFVFIIFAPLYSFFHNHQAHLLCGTVKVFWIAENMFSTYPQWLFAFSFSFFVVNLLLLFLFPFLCLFSSVINFQASTHHLCFYVIARVMGWLNENICFRHFIFLLWFSPPHLVMFMFMGESDNEWLRLLFIYWMTWADLEWASHPVRINSNQMIIFHTWFNTHAKTY